MGLSWPLGIAPMSLPRGAVEPGGLIAGGTASYTNTFLYGPLRPLKMHLSGMDSVHSIVDEHGNLGAT